MAIIGPDSPTRQDHTHGQVRHAMGGNFMLQNSGELRNATPNIGPFHHPHPGPGTGAHRYDSSKHYR